ncbi:hypothetical protein LBMAG15_20330 [Actinomycetes bacterium]|nr:hypothetical protein LBMAG15_20330 [Actinomycetes bacterium]
MSCARCGNSLDPLGNYCSICGLPAAGAGRRRNFLWALATAVILALPLSLYAYYQFSRQHQLCGDALQARDKLLTALNDAQRTQFQIYKDMRVFDWQAISNRYPEVEQNLKTYCGIDPPSTPTPTPAPSTPTPAPSTPTPTPAPSTPTPDPATRNCNLNRSLVGANLESCDLSRRDLIGVDLAGANLRGANLSSAKLVNANLSGADLRSADLSSANLTGADLRNADLRAANLNFAGVDGADLTGANLTGSSGALRGTPKR